MPDVPARGNIRSTVERWLFNLFPAFRRSGARITRISADNRRIDLKLPLRRATRNYVGTIYGGAMYSALDGILMVMFIRLLGRQFIVWDKSGRIEYLKPGRETLYATAQVTDEQLDEVRTALRTARTFENEYTLEWRTAAGDVCCRVHKLLYFRRKDASA